MHFHGVSFGRQHEIWSKQHNGKVSFVVEEHVPGYIYLWRIPEVVSQRLAQVDQGIDMYIRLAHWLPVCLWVMERLVYGRDGIHGFSLLPLTAGQTPIIAA